MSSKTPQRADVRLLVRVSVNSWNILEQVLDGAPGEIRTPDPLLRSCGVRKSKCLIVRCLRAKVTLKPVLSWATNLGSNIWLVKRVLPPSITTLGPRGYLSGIDFDGINPPNDLGHYL